MARGAALAAALAVALLAVSAAGGAAPQQTPKRGGTVVVAANAFSEPACLGWLEICDPLARAQWRDKVLARPFVVGPRGLRNHLVEPELSREPFTVTFHIRPEARWSDGVPVTAGDFVFAYETYLEHSDYPVRWPELETKIRRVRPVDAKTVRFVFRERYGNWRSLLNFPPLPRHVLRGQDLASQSLWRQRIDNPRTGTPIGSGPFLVGSWELGKQVTLVRNPRYWGRHTAYLDRIILRFIRAAGADVEQALRREEVDLGVATPSPELERDPRFSTLSTPAAGWEHYEVRVRPGGHPALADKLVRRALAFAIDRTALTRDLFGASAPVLNNTMYLSNEAGYAPNWSRYRYDPARSRRLLRQAGCSLGGDGIYSCAGERMRLRFIATAGVPLRARNLEVVATQLRRAGVEVVATFAPNVQLFASVLEAGDFDVALFNYGKPEPELVDSPFRCGSSASGYCSRLVNADLDQLDRILEPARRVAVANRIDRRLAEDVPALPLFQVPLVYVVRKGLQGVVPNGFGALTTGGAFWNAEDWWLAEPR